METGVQDSQLWSQSKGGSELANTYGQQFGVGYSSKEDYD